jgi:serine/threonine protein kinase
LSLPAGTKLGAYEILAPLGAGGMGEVYRARDAKLNRDVAIKILPAALASDPAARARFEREAQAVAALSHPNILGIFDFGIEHDVPFAVMELLDGATLREQLHEGAIGARKSIEYAQQIAAGLGAAHARGITHRDLKPENVFVTRDGRIKILDFGLAKIGPGADAAGPSMLATSPALTGAGTIVGTVGYMSPEQVRGRDVDHRSDVFSFGAILYELLSGRCAFTGDSAVETMNAILKEDPPELTRANAALPPALDRIVRRCLEKNPDERFHSARDVAFALDAISTTRSDAAISGVLVTAPTRMGKTNTRRIAAVVTLTLVVGAAGYLVGARRATGTSEAPELRLQIVTGPTDDPSAFAISPDGRQLIFQSTIGGKSQLWLRTLDSETAKALPGTEGATNANPFWSPDSQSVAFTAADGRLTRIDLGSGLVRTLTPSTLGAAWTKEGAILFARTTTGPLRRIPASGGATVEVTRMDPPRVTGHWYPTFLPDGRHFVFWGWGLPDYKGVYAGSLDSMETRRLFDADSRPVFAPPDRVLFARQKALMAQRLDLKTMQPVGEATTVAARALVIPFFVAASASAAGPIAYRAAGPEWQLAWVDRSGHETGVVGGPDLAPRSESGIRLSPDGRTVALTRSPVLWNDVWLIETGTGVPQPFTSDVANKFTPTWSPKGDRIVFSWDPKGVLELYEKPLEAAGNGTLLWSSPEHKNVMDWSPEGRFILYRSDSETTASDLWAIPYTSASGERKPIEVAHESFDEDNGRFSPDGRWIAYQSNETGRSEIVVQPFPGSGTGKRRITRDGGTLPQWRGDGRELFYLASDNRLMAMPIRLNTSTIEPGTPAPLFALPAQSGYAASRDGQRFLVNKIVKDAAPITILLNWKPK